MLHQFDDALLHAMFGTEQSRVRTEFRFLPPEACKLVGPNTHTGGSCPGNPSSLALLNEFHGHVA